MINPTHRIRLVAAAAGLVAVAAVAVPVMGGAMREVGSGSPAVAAESEPPGHGPKVEKPGKGTKPARADKLPTTPVTKTGRVGTRTAADGDTVYTLTVGSTVLDLEAGPPWWWGDDHPLEGLVGTTVTIAGEQAADASSIEVASVNGTAIRDAGRPPWAGGWKVVGKRHPGWSQEKADRAAARAKEHTTGRPPWAGPNPSEEPGD
jgi:hypothetical protein